MGCIGELSLPGVEHACDTTLSISSLRVGIGRISTVGGCLKSATLWGRRTKLSRSSFAQTSLCVS